MRMNRLFKCSVALLLVSVIILGMAGCGSSQEKESDKQTEIEPMEAEEAVTLSYDIIGGKDVMPIFGYYGPVRTLYSADGNDIPDYYTDEFFELIAESGVNIITMNHTYPETYTANFDTMMTLAEKYDIGIFARDQRIETGMSKDTPLEHVASFVNEYSHYKSYVGNYVCDEPGWSEGYLHVAGRDIYDYEYKFSALNELGIVAYGNLHPPISGYNYYDYIKEYATACKPKFLSMDYYEYKSTSVIQSNLATYFYALTTLRQVAEEEGIPFYTFIQAGGNWNDGGTWFDTESYFPTRGMLYWDVNVSLAYGVTGIQYFPLLQTAAFSFAESTPFDTQRNGLIGSMGNKTRWYYYAQDMNKQIAAVDEVLMNSVNKGVLASNEEIREDLTTYSNEQYDNPYLLEGTSWRELAGVSGDALIGCFNYQGKTALYVVNYDTEYAQKIQLDFVDSYNIKVIQEAETSYWNCEELELVLAAGDGALIVFE